MENNIRELVISSLNLSDEDTKKVNELNKAKSILAKKVDELLLKVNAIDLELKEIGLDEQTISTKVKAILRVMQGNVPANTRKTRKVSGSQIFLVNGKKVDLPADKFTLGYFLQRETNGYQGPGTYMKTGEFWRLAREKYPEADEVAVLPEIELDILIGEDIKTITRQYVEA